MADEYGACDSNQKLCYFQIYKTLEKKKECSYLFTKQSRRLTTLQKMPFENIVGKEENAGNQHFLLFPQCFLSYPEQILPFGQSLICRLQMLSTWIGLKFCCLVTG